MKDFSLPASRPHICLPQINFLYCSNSVEFRIGVNGDVGARIVEEDDGELVGFYISNWLSATLLRARKLTDQG